MCGSATTEPRYGKAGPGFPAVHHHGDGDQRHAVSACWYVPDPGGVPASAGYPGVCQILLWTRTRSTTRISRNMEMLYCRWITSAPMRSARCARWIRWMDGFASVLYASKWDAPIVSRIAARGVQTAGIPAMRATRRRLGAFFAQLRSDWPYRRITGSRLWKLWFRVHAHAPLRRSGSTSRSSWFPMVASHCPVRPLDPESRSSLSFWSQAAMLGKTLSCFGEFHFDRTSTWPFKATSRWFRTRASQTTRFRWCARLCLAREYNASRRHRRRKDGNWIFSLQRKDRMDMSSSTTTPICKA